MAACSFGKIAETGGVHTEMNTPAQGSVGDTPEQTAHDRRARPDHTARHDEAGAAIRDVGDVDAHRHVEQRARQMGAGADAG